MVNYTISIFHEVSPHNWTLQLSQALAAYVHHGHPTSQQTELACCCSRWVNVGAPYPWFNCNVFLLHFAMRVCSINFISTNTHMSICITIDFLVLDLYWNYYALSLTYPNIPPPPPPPLTTTTASPSTTMNCIYLVRSLLFMYTISWRQINMITSWFMHGIKKNIQEIQDQIIMPMSCVISTLHAHTRTHACTYTHRKQKTKSENMKRPCIKQNAHRAAINSGTRLHCTSTK